MPAQVWVLACEVYSDLSPMLSVPQVYTNNTGHLSITQAQPPTQHINLKLYPIILLIQVAYVQFFWYSLLWQTFISYLGKI